MDIFSTWLALCAGNSPVTGEFPSQRPVTWSFDVFFDLRLHKRMSKQSWGWWFETPSRPLWRHCNVNSWYHIMMSSHERHVLSNHRSLGCLFNCLFGPTSRKHQSPHYGLCEGNSPVSGEFPAQATSNAENSSIWWRHHDLWPKWWEVSWPSSHNFSMFIYRWLNAKRLDQITDALELRLFCPKPSIPWPLLTQLLIIKLIILRRKGMLIFPTIPQQVCGTRLRRALLKKKINFLQLVQIMASMTLPESVTVLRLFNHHSNSGLEWWEPSICTVCRLNGTK